MRRFIYLDTDTLNSYIAQIYDGLVQTQETETQSAHSVNKQSEQAAGIGGNADLTVFGKGLEGKIDFTYRHLRDTTNSNLISDVQTKLLHDNAFDQLMNYLTSKGLLLRQEIGDFIKIQDSFYIMDLDYYQKLFDDKKLIEFLIKSEEEKQVSNLKLQQDAALLIKGANVNEIKRHFQELRKNVCNEIKSSYNNIKDTIDILIAIIPYRRTLCIANNMVVLNDKYMRDSIDMTSFKYGGKVNVLGYITNTISNKPSDNETPIFAQIGNVFNEIMLSFFADQSKLNIVHPIAIYYE
ncbi:MAG: hypothetical protein K2N41_01405 [Lachnospiraceae bacterium]|nr:hypothetical protein [Lachnospiraceae bacterium]MDE7238352.1 hypothetical protein [Lachnospiraceae bacterium]